MMFTIFWLFSWSYITFWQSSEPSLHNRYTFALSLMFDLRNICWMLWSIQIQLWSHPWQKDQIVSTCLTYFKHTGCLSNPSVSILLCSIGDTRLLHESSWNIASLTHWGRDKMAAIFQTTVSNGFSWTKMLEFRLKFHWSLFPRVWLTIF